MICTANYLSLYFVAFPTFLNLFIIFYIYLYLPKTKLTNIFIIFLIALIFWQVEEIIMRSGITQEQAVFFDQVYSMGWLAIGPLIVHFACLFTKVKWIQSRGLIFALYAPFIFFFSLYHANPDTILMHQNSFWGYTTGIRPNSLDLIQRFWVGGMVLLGISILTKFIFKNDIDPIKRKQSLLIIIGLLLPTLQGSLTQIIFPLLGKTDIPLTTTMMTFFSISVLIALSKYHLFDPYESIDVQKAFDAVNSMVMIFSPDLYSKYYNPEVSRKIRGSIRSTSFHIAELFSKNTEDYREFVINIIDPLNAGEKIPEYETCFVSVCGQKINILLSAQPIFNNRKIHFLLFVCHDITTRVNAENELIRSNERFSFATKATNEAIRDWDIAKDEMIWEEGFCNLFGFVKPQPDNALNNWVNFLHPSERDLILKNLETSIYKKSSNQWNAEYRFLKNDGSYAFVEDKAFIIRDKHKNGIRMIGAIRDVTSQKEYLKAIEVKNIQLQEISWIQSHEIRAPLANILGLVSILMEKQLNEEDREIYLQSLQKSSVDLDHIIRKIVLKTKSDI